MRQRPTAAAGRGARARGGVGRSGGGHHQLHGRVLQQLGGGGHHPDRWEVAADPFGASAGHRQESQALLGGDQRPV
jgi:hypothetical protein